MLDKNIEAFKIHITLVTSKILIYLAWKTQITSLLAQKIIVLTKYLDFIAIFLKKSSCGAFQILYYKQILNLPKTR